MFSSVMLTPDVERETKTSSKTGTVVLGGDRGGIDPTSLVDLIGAPYSVHGWH